MKYIIVLLIPNRNERPTYECNSKAQAELFIDDAKKACEGLEWIIKEAKDDE